MLTGKHVSKTLTLNKMKTNKMLLIRCRLTLIWNESTSKWIYLWKPNVKCVKVRLHSKWGLLPRKPINNSKNYFNVCLSCLKQIQQMGDKIYENSDIREADAFLHHYILIDQNTFGRMVNFFSHWITYLACCLSVPV